MTSYIESNPVESASRQGNNNNKQLKTRQFTVGIPKVKEQACSYIIRKCISRICITSNDENFTFGVHNYRNEQVSPQLSMHFDNSITDASIQVGYTLVKNYQRIFLESPSKTPYAIIAHDRQSDDCIAILVHHQGAFVKCMMISTWSIYGCITCFCMDLVITCFTFQVHMH